MKSHRAIDLNRRLPMLFYSNNVLDTFEAPEPQSPEEVVISHAISEIKLELIEIVKKCARRKNRLTDYQKTLFEGVLTKSFVDIAKDLGYEIPNNGSYAVYVGLNGYNKRNKEKKRVGGIYKKIRTRVAKNTRVRELLSLLEKIRGGDYTAALTYLQKKNPEIWLNWHEEI